ncbi:MAG: hypothetical protein FJ356_04815 [Thaumarchaeota archaeon]|nr:hypothetical protein [Nitrososphaerota archaeon]
MAKKKNHKKSKQNDIQNKSFFKKEVYAPIIISAIITIIVTSVFYHLSIEPEPCVQGPTGNIYRDCLMRFEITKPNRDWKFHYEFNIDVPKFDIHFPGQSIVEMVLAERTNNEQVVVIVFDDQTDINLHEFVEKELELARIANLPMAITYTEPISDNDEITMFTELYNSHEEKKILKLFKERVIKKDGLVYVIHSQIRSVDDVTEKVKSEVDGIFNSFKFI